MSTDRQLHITAPPHGFAGERVSVHVTANGEEHDQESIAMLHIEYSTDGGKSWNAYSYDDDLGPSTTNAFDIELGPAATTTVIRSRAAFRNEQIGTVDFTGNLIEWDTSWDNWQEPPTRYASIRVK